MDKNVPEIRFKGFITKWEQKKLGEIANIIDPHPSHRAPEETKEGVPFIGIGDVDVDGTINYHNVRIVDEKEYEEHHRRYDLAIPSLGIGRVASLGKVIRLRNDIGKYTVSPTLSIMQFNTSSDLDFLFSAMSSPLFQKQFTSLSNGSTRQSVGIQDLRAIEISISSDEDEQKEIGSFFKYMDDLISLETRELDTLKTFKKSCLEKMFPKEGETMPELRFEGFTDAWEQRKLGEITEISSGQNVPNEDGGKYYNLTMGSVNTEGHLVCSLHTNRSDRLLVKGTLIMPTRDVGAGYVIGRTAVIDENDKYYAGNCLYCLSTGLNEPYYIHHYMNSEMARKSMQIIVAGGSQKQITLPGIKSIEVPICSIEEQRKIAQLFNDFDKTITLHQRKLDKLKSLKQACLEKMFV